MGRIIGYKPFLISIYELKDRIEEYINDYSFNTIDVNATRIDRDMIQHQVEIFDNKYILFNPNQNLITIIGSSKGEYREANIKVTDYGVEFRAKNITGKYEGLKTLLRVIKEETFQYMLGE